MQMPTILKMIWRYRKSSYLSFRRYGIGDNGNCARVASGQVLSTSPALDPDNTIPQTGIINSSADSITSM